MLDPLADKLLFVSVFAALTWVDLVPVWLLAVVVGRDVVIEPGVVLRGFCHIGEGASIGANCVLDDAAVGAGERIPPLTYLTGE